MKSENLPHNDLYREHAAYSRTEDIHIYIIQICHGSQVSRNSVN
jgi:hypothetical protein